MPVGHALDVHEFLVVRAIVLHDLQERNMVMGHGPQNSRGIHHVSVTVDADGQPAMLLVRKRGARGSRRAVALARAARAANELIMFVEGP